jgi:hypothetical protein
MNTSASLFARLFSRRHSRRIEQLGGEIARQCRVVLWRRVSRAAFEISAAELRGYARAMAGDLVAAETELSLKRHRLRESWREEAQAAGIEQLIELIVHDAVGEQFWSASRPIAA